jgi:hypothetical protein
VCLINQALRHEGVWESEDIAPPFLISALDGGEWSASRLGRLIAGETAPGTHWMGRLVGPLSQSGRYGEEKHLCPLPGIEPRPPSP